MSAAHKLFVIPSALLCALLLASICSLPAHAVGGNLKQQILPLNCVYQVVNDGTGTLIFLTPEECGQIPDIDVDPGDTDTPVDPFNPPSVVVTVVDSGPGIFQVPFIPTTAGPEENREVIAGTEYLPYVPLANLNPENTAVEEETLNNAIVVATPVIAMGAIVLILLALLILL